MDRDLIWVVEKDNIVEGFSHLAMMSEVSAEILGLYLSQKMIGQGAGRELFLLMQAEALNQGIQQIELLATLTAKDFYQKMGCQEISGLTSLMFGGVPIRCVPMMYKFQLR